MSAAIQSSIINPIVSVGKVVLGTAQTSNGTVTNTAFADFTNQPTLSITPARSSRFKVWCNAMASSATLGATVGLTIIASTGSPSVAFQGDVAFLQAVATDMTAVLVYGYFDLVSGTAYAFKLQGKASAGQVTLASATPASGICLIAEEFSQ